MTENRKGCLLFLLALMLCPLVTMFHAWVLKEIYELTFLPSFAGLPKLDLLFFIGVVLVHGVMHLGSHNKSSEFLREILQARRGIVFLETAIKSIAEKLEVIVYGSGPSVKKEPTVAETFGTIITKECSIMLTELLYMAFAWGFAAILL